MNDSDAKPAGTDGSEHWQRVDDSTSFECFYRFTGDGQVEILALGARVVVPIKALSLLPESIARAVLNELAKRAARELRKAANSAPSEEEP